MAFGLTWEADYNRGQGSAANFASRADAFRS